MVCLDALKLLPTNFCERTDYSYKYLAKRAVSNLHDRDNA